MTTFVNNDVASNTTIYASDHNQQGALIAGVLNGNVDANNLASNAVTTTKLADSAVTTAKIADDAVTIEKLNIFASSYTAEVATEQTTTSTSFTDLATAGPAVTVTIGSSGNALVILSAILANTATQKASFMGFVASGANTIAAANGKSAYLQSAIAGGSGSVSKVVVLTGLTPGSTTFTSKYSVEANTGSFKNRVITVIPL